MGDEENIRHTDPEFMERIIGLGPFDAGKRGEASARTRC
jgi:hypothetical protein